MQNIYNVIDFYNVQNVPVESTYQIDTKDCIDVRIVNTSTAGLIFVNNVILQPLGTGKNIFQYRGNEGEIFDGKIYVETANIVGNINYSFAVIRKTILKDATPKLQGRFFEFDKQPGSKKRLR